MSTGISAGCDRTPVATFLIQRTREPASLSPVWRRGEFGPADVTAFRRRRITLGNQLDGVNLSDPEIVERFKKRYPDGDCMKPPP